MYMATSESWTIKAKSQWGPRASRPGTFPSPGFATGGCHSQSPAPSLCTLSRFSSGAFWSMLEVQVGKRREEKIEKAAIKKRRVRRNWRKHVFSYLEDGPTPDLLWFYTSWPWLVSATAALLIPWHWPCEHESLGLLGCGSRCLWEMRDIAFSGRRTSYFHPCLTNRFCLNPNARSLWIL